MSQILIERIAANLCITVICVAFFILIYKLTRKP